MLDKVFYIREGDLLPQLRVALAVKGESLSLNLATTVRIKYLKLDDTTVQSHDGAVDSETVVIFNWSTPFTKGMYKFYVEVIFSGDKKMTFPNHGFGTIIVSGVDP